MSSSLFQEGVARRVLTVQGFLISGVLFLGTACIPSSNKTGVWTLDHPGHRVEQDLATWPRSSCLFGVVILSSIKLKDVWVASLATSCCSVFQLSMEKVQAMAEQVEIKAKVVQSEVKALVLRHKKALEERECELLWKVSSANCTHQS